MFKNILSLAKESIIYGLSTVTARFLNFLLVPFYTYFLVTADYGIIATVFSYIALLNIFYQYGMDQAYLRFASEEKENKNIFSTPFWAILFTAVFISGFIAINAENLAEICGIGITYKNLIIYSALVMALDALAIIPFAHLRITHKAWNFVAVRTASIVVNISLNIILVGFLKLGIKGVFISAAAASSMSVILLLPVILKRLKFNFDKKIFREMFSFAWPFIPAGIGAMIIQVIDKPIMLFLTNSATVGVYQANYKMGIFMLLVVGMFDQAWRPFFLEHAKCENAKEIFAKVFTYFAVCGVWIVFALSFFIENIIKTSFFGIHLLHPNYWGGIKIIPIILVGYLFDGCYINFMAAPLIAKKTKVILKVTLTAAAINILANFILIKHFAMTGAAVATLISYFATASILFLMSRKFYPINYEWRRILHLIIISGVILATYFTAKFTLENNLLIYAKGLLLILFPFLLFITGFFTKREKDIIKRVAQLK